MIALLGGVGCDRPEAEEVAAEVVEEVEEEPVKRSTVAVPETFERLDLPLNQEPGRVGAVLIGMVATPLG